MPTSYTAGTTVGQTILKTRLLSVTHTAKVNNCTTRAYAATCMTKPVVATTSVPVFYGAGACISIICHASCARR